MPDQEARGKPGQGYSFDQRGASNPEQSWSHTSHQERVEAVRAKLQERLLRRKAEFLKGDERYFSVEEVQFMEKIKWTQWCVKGKNFGSRFCMHRTHSLINITSLDPFRNILQNIGCRGVTTI